MQITAREFADDGQWARGYDCLTRGLQQAKEAAEHGEPWAAELVLRYLQAMDEYIARHGVRIE